jgi:hypothetical protein
MLFSIALANRDISNCITFYASSMVTISDYDLLERLINIYEIEGPSNMYDGNGKSAQRLGLKLQRDCTSL